MPSKGEAAAVGPRRASLRNSGPLPGVLRPGLGRSSFLPAAAFVVAVVGSLLFAGEARAQVKLEANYRVSLIGLPLGHAAWIVDLDEDRYTMAATAQVSGLVQVFSSGEGSGAAKGLLQGNRIVPQSYAVAIRTKNRVDDVRMTYAGTAVKQIAIEPSYEPSPVAVPVTEAHKRGTVDPFSAGLVPATGFGPEACQRSLPMFDGRIRFELALNYKRTEQARDVAGYKGPVLVCSVTFKPIAGHEPNRPAIRYLSGSQSIEMWLAPIEGTRLLAMYRIVVPTVLGAATLEATRFAVVGKPPQAARVGNGKGAAKASEAKPAEAKPVEAKPAEAKPAEAKPADAMARGAEKESAH